MTSELRAVNVGPSLLNTLGYSLGMSVVLQSQSVEGSGKGIQRSAVLLRHHQNMPPIVIVLIVE